MDYSYFNYPSPIGILKVRFTAVGILGISFPQLNKIRIVRMNILEKKTYPFISISLMN